MNHELDKVSIVVVLGEKDWHLYWQMSVCTDKVQSGEISALFVKRSVVMVVQTWVWVWQYFFSSMLGSIGLHLRLVRSFYSFPFPFLPLFLVGPLGLHWAWLEWNMGPNRDSIEESQKKKRWELEVKLTSYKKINN